MIKDKIVHNRMYMDTPEGDPPKKSEVIQDDMMKIMNE